MAGSFRVGIFHPALHPFACFPPSQNCLMKYQSDPRFMVRSGSVAVPPTSVCFPLRYRANISVSTRSSHPPSQEKIMESQHRQEALRVSMEEE